MELYLECYYGISGDMFVASLLDLGASKEKLRKTLSQLGLDDEFEIRISRVLKAGIEANDFDVVYNKNQNIPNRNLEDIEKILDRLEDEKIKKLAKKIFRIVAQSEKEVHGKKIEEVYFHEEGAIDSIVDIVSASFCIVDLGIESVYSSTLYEGSGLIYMKKKEKYLPIPTPAVLNILTKYQLPIKITNQEGEFITPTGIAIVAALRNKKTLPKEYKIIKVGLGAGKRYQDKPSILRAMLIKEEK